jgi:hypothetical protein
MMGLIPCTHALGELKRTEANLAHCKLGGEGTIALARALAVNTVICSLDLTDNGVDAQVGFGAVLLRDAPNMANTFLI